MVAAVITDGVAATATVDDTVGGDTADGVAAGAAGGVVAGATGGDAAGAVGVSRSRPGRVEVPSWSRSGRARVAPRTAVGNAAVGVDGVSAAACEA